jgi:hypothetical protein
MAAFISMFILEKRRNLSPNWWEHPLIFSAFEELNHG